MAAFTTLTSSGMVASVITAVVANAIAMRASAIPIVALITSFGTVTTSMMVAVAWVAIMAPVSCLTELMGGSSRSANRIITSIFNAVALITLVDLTFQAGTISLVDWVNTWPIMSAAHDDVSAQHDV